MRWSTPTCVCVLLMCSVGCSELPLEDATHDTEQHQQAIRNGTREPQLVHMSEGQKLAIGWIYSDNTSHKDFCSGTLITPHHVLTAAHCTFGWSAERLGFGVGQDPSWPIAVFEVARIIDHPDVDLSLLELSEPVTNKVPQLVPLPINTTRLNDWEEGIDVEAAGYGLTHKPGASGRWFAVLELEAINSYELVVNGNGRRGLCFGDSGGPLMRNNAQGKPVVIGVESLGEGDCLGRDFLIRLDMFTSWFNTYIGALPMPDPDDFGEIPCLNVRYAGQCDADILVRCEGGEVVQEDCAGFGLQCGYISAFEGYGCTEAPQPILQPGCEDGEDFCDAHNRINCVTGVFERYDCGMMDMSCDLGPQGEASCAEVELPENWRSPFGDDSEEMEEPEEQAIRSTRARPSSGCQHAPMHPLHKRGGLLFLLMGAVLYGRSLKRFERGPTSM